MSNFTPGPWFIGEDKAEKARMEAEDNLAGAFRALAKARGE